MSEPMTNVKIEDVLSSIRRLVAEGTQDTSPPRSMTPRGPLGRLVLTPSDRVDLDPQDSRDAPEPPLQLRPSDRQDVPARPRSSASDLLSTIAELEAAVLGQAEEWEDDGTGTDLDKSWASAGFRNDGPVEDAEEVDPADWPDTLAEARRIFGETSHVERDENEGDGPDSDDGVVFRHRREDAAPREARSHRTHDEAEYHDDLMPVSDDDFDSAELAQLTLYLEGGGGITRAALAQIVRDIVREELQGQMGERVTRNVRKLVRREIHRALTTSDLS